MKGSPFPQGFKLENGITLGRATFTCDDTVWIHTAEDGHCVIFAGDPASQAGNDGIEWTSLSYGEVEYRYIAASGSMNPLSKLRRPQSTIAAMAFARAISRVPTTIGAAIFIESHETLVRYPDPTVPDKNKAQVLGAYLTGGVDVSADDVVALQRILPKVPPDEISNILEVAGITPKTPVSKGGKVSKVLGSSENEKSVAPFELAGRRDLSNFFNEHVIDIVVDEKRYAAMGIGFPGGIILEGPTGCGKTFAVERLVQHLGWPSFSIEASSVASPYIHETSRKVAEIFGEAMKAAPAVVVIDEMDAFLANRDSGSQQHSVEEVAEFLRRIPEATANRVLVIGMTNKLNAIDPAILRRGRFDHVIHVDHAGEDEVSGLLEFLLRDIPHDVRWPLK